MSPKLLERRDLLPNLRSFSEHELAARPSARLALTCVAQCEPVCAVGWQLNGRPLDSPAPPSGARQSGEQEREQEEWLRLRAQHSLARSNASAFTWTSRSSWSPADAPAPPDTPTGGASEWAPEEANAWGRLELPYALLGRLLGRHEQLSARCAPLALPGLAYARLPAGHWFPPMGAEQLVWAPNESDWPAWAPAGERRPPGQSALVDDMQISILLDRK